MISYIVMSHGAKIAKTYVHIYIYRLSVYLYFFRVRDFMTVVVRRRFTSLIHLMHI